MKKDKLKQHFRFNWKERIAFVVLIAIIALTFAYPYFFAGKDSDPITITLSSEMKKRATEQREVDDSDRVYGNQSNNNNPRGPNSFYNEPQRVVRLFYFDPNTATQDQWQTLGLRDRTIRTIKNYLSKGGSFRQKEDLRKIYGLHEDEYEKLAPFIKIPPKEESKLHTAYFSNYRSTYSYTKPVDYSARLTINDINTADAEAFIALPGIGEKLAARIMNFRDKLGGFYSVEQVGETYALPDSTFQLIKQYLKLNSPVKKININSATKDDLKSHPYIRWNLGNVIVEYRNQHGPFKSLEDLKKIVLIDEATYQKIIPYLEL